MTVSAIHDTYPGIIKVFEYFDIYPQPADAPDRARSDKGISSYLTTILLFG
jgi:hypothetical protein